MPWSSVLAVSTPPEILHSPHSYENIPSKVNGKGQTKEASKLVTSRVAPEKANVSPASSLLSILHSKVSSPSVVASSKQAVKIREISHVVMEANTLEKAGDEIKEKEDSNTNSRINVTRLLKKDIRLTGSAVEASAVGTKSEKKAVKEGSVTKITQVLKKDLRFASDATDLVEVVSDSSALESENKNNDVKVGLGTNITQLLKKNLHPTLDAADVSAAQDYKNEIKGGNKDLKVGRVTNITNLLKKELSAAPESMDDATQELHTKIDTTERKEENKGPGTVASVVKGVGDDVSMTTPPQNVESTLYPALSGEGNAARKALLERVNKMKKKKAVVIDSKADPAASSKSSPAKIVPLDVLPLGHANRMMDGENTTEEEAASVIESVTQVVAFEKVAVPLTAPLVSPAKMMVPFSVKNRRTPAKQK